VGIVGPSAFAVLTGPGSAPLAVIAAAEHGAGRVVVLTHDCYATAPLRSSRLWRNVVAWAAGEGGGGEAAVRVLTTADVALRRSFNAAEFVHFVSHGGGAVVAVTPWGWQQLNGQASLADNCPVNVALRQMGLVLTEGTVTVPAGGYFLVAASRPQLASAWHAVYASHEEHVGWHAVMQLRTALPPADRAAWSQNLQRRILGGDAVAVDPTPEHPLELAAEGDRSPAAMLLATVHLAPTASVLPHVPSFPGAAPPESPRISRDVTARVTTPGCGAGAGEWVSTHLYASPGDVITAVVLWPSPLAAIEWRLRVGCHRDDLSHASSLRRWPAVSQTAELQPTGVTSLHVVFGGLVYLEAASIHAAPVCVRLSGAVAAPHASAATGFVLHDAGSAPWGELAGERVIITVPAADLRAATARDSTALARAAAFWDAVLLSHQALAPPPYGARPERVVADVQIAAGLMHAGYPIMVDTVAFDQCYPRLSFGRGVLDVAAATSVDDGDGGGWNWGLFHELGHNLQRTAWTWPAASEVTVNLFTLWTYENLLHTPAPAAYARWQHQSLAAVTRDLQADWDRGCGYSGVADSAQHDHWPRCPARALRMFVALIHRFGWRAIIDTLAVIDQRHPSFTVDVRPPAAVESNSEPAVDAWVVALSAVLGQDMAPYFRCWGLCVAAQRS
jgi:hypothetical protein